MSGICERCNERTSYIINISRATELAAVAYLGYRLVCSDCYDDLLAEANEAVEQDEDRRQEDRVPVSIKALVEGNTSQMEPFSEEMVIKEISLSGLRLQTVRNIEPGSVVKITINSHHIETTAIAETMWRDGVLRSVGLKLVEPSESWEALYYDNVPEE